MSKPNQLKTPVQIQAMRDGGQMLAIVLDILAKTATPGMTPLDLSHLAGQELARQFVSQVLYRYDWGIAPEIAKSTSPGRADLVESIVQRREGQISMPTWQGEPVVTAHILDVYAYLSARAAGTQGPERP